MNSVELYLSTDGKHTVHVQAADLADAQAVLPDALRLYRQITTELGTKPALWEPVMTGKRAGAGNGQAGNGVAPANGVPVCRVHGTPLVLRQGPRGPFWSCPQKDNGQWCRVTQEVA